MSAARNRGGGLTSHIPNKSPTLDILITEIYMTRRRGYVGDTNYHAATTVLSDIEWGQSLGGIRYVVIPKSLSHKLPHRDHRSDIE